MNGKLLTIIIITVAILSIYVIISTTINTTNKIDECNKMSECDRLGCLSETAVSVFQMNNYLLKQQNCILKQMQQNEKETQTN